MSEDIEQPLHDRRVSMLYTSYEKYKYLNLLELHSILEYIQTPEGKKFAKDVRKKELEEIGILQTFGFPDEAVDSQYMTEISMLESLTQGYDMNFKKESNLSKYYFYGEVVLESGSEKKKIYIEKETRRKLETEIIRQASNFGADHNASLPIEYSSFVSDSSFDENNENTKKQNYVYVELIKSNLFKDEESFFEYWDNYMHDLGMAKN